MLKYLLVFFYTKAQFTEFTINYDCVGPDLYLGLLHNKVAYTHALRELIHVVQRMHGPRNLLKQILAKPCHRFAYLCLDNVKMYYYANLD